MEERSFSPVSHWFEGTILVSGSPYRARTGRFLHRCASTQEQPPLEVAAGTPLLRMRSTLLERTGNFRGTDKESWNDDGLEAFGRDNVVEMHE
jgi:hypothetical protein